MTWQKALTPSAHLKTSHIDIDSHRAARIAAQFGTTEIVLSFGAAGGGALFAKWLRWQLMQRFGLHQPNAVYLDTVGLSLVPETNFTVREKSRPWLTGVASLNGGWRAYYRVAISQCHTMLFVGTQAFAASPWTQGELEYFNYERARRLREGGTPLRGVALILPGATGDTFAGMELIDCQQNMVNDRFGDWTLDGPTLLRVLAACKRR
jgi:hypothetical protein